MEAVLQYKKEYCTNCMACNIACRNRYPERKGKVRACSWCIRSGKEKGEPVCALACPLRLITYKI